MKKIFLVLGIIGMTFSANAQLLDGINVELTKADTLRGALRPERTCFDVHYYHLKLNITDMDGKTITGSNEIHYNVMEDFTTLQLDLFDNMSIESIVHNGKYLEFTREYNAVFVHFDDIQKKGTQGEIVVMYSGQPIIAENPPWDGGFTWQESGSGKPWIGVSCEGIGASLWWPNKDHLSDEPDSMRVTCTVPSGLTFVGNGQLEERIDMKNDMTQFTWKMSYPINNYNVTINIGDYVNFQDEYTAADGEKLLLDYWVLPENLDKAKTQFEQVSPMLGCFEQYFGKFPFWQDNYKLVETPYLGMEHQTAIAYGNEYKTGYAGWDISRIGLDFDYIIIHETGHEYWGNSIGCQDMADLWIHEGFCTYSEALYVECMYDYELGQDYVNAKKPTIGNEYPMIGIYDVNVEGDGDMYNKGMLFLNTVRHIINDDELWFEMLLEMNTKFAYQTITTDDVIA
ncbi:MAG: M1 family metallopeptidase, partial [Chitinophagales bacterium]